MLEIAGVRVALVIDEPALAFEVNEATSHFLAPASANLSSADSTIHFTLGELSPDEPTGELLFDSGGVWRLYREGDGYLYRFVTTYFGPTPYREAHFNHDFSAGRVVCHEPYLKDWIKVDPLEHPLNQWLYFHLLTRRRGAAVHSCGLVDEHGNAYLFPAQSGGGKTTSARLWAQHPEVTLLSDERTIIREVDGEFWLYGTPWHGEGRMYHNGRAPLRRIFFLNKGPRNEFKPISPTEAAMRLFSCSFPAFYDATDMNAMLDFYEAVCQNVPAEVLSFVPNQSAVNAVRERVS